jgi:regulator of sirC expression with transglutaminase-like and TPR domain
MTAGSRERFAAAMRADHVDLGLACLLVGAEVAPDLDVDAGLAALDALAADAAPTFERATTAEEVASALGSALGTDAGLHGTAEDFDDLRSSLLHEVLQRRRGLPILLSVVYVEVARRLGHAVGGIGLPGHFVVGVLGDGEPVLLDPFMRGRRTTAAELAARATDLTGTPVLLAGDALVPWTEVEIVGRVLANIRAHAASRDSLRTQLWALDLALVLPRHSATLRRERGQVLARLGDYVGSAAELERYAEAVAGADPAAAEKSLRDAKLVRSRLS